MGFSRLVCEMSAIVWYFEHSLALPFFGIEMTTDFSSPVATAEFSRFLGREYSTFTASSFRI